MFQIIFTYCEDSRKWEVKAIGATNETEAKQGFNAVLITCGKPIVGMDHKTKPNPDGSIEIIPAA